MEGYPLSPQQRRIWHLGRDRGLPARTRGRFSLRGPLPVDGLAAAVARLVERYELLRTAFPTPAGMKLPIQVVGEGAEGSFRLRHHDLSGLPVERRAAALEELGNRLGEVRLDLEAGPWLHLGLVRLGEGDHRLLAVQPTLHGDRRSLANLVAELLTLWAGNGAAGGAEPGEGPFQYADLGQWQHEMLASPEAEEGAAYWTRAGRPAVGRLELPERTGDGAEGEATVGGVATPATVEVAVDAALLERRAKEAGVPAEALLLAAWQAVLGRQVGDPQPVVAVVCDGRTYEGLGEAVGPLARAVPLHAGLDPAGPFRQAATAAYRGLDEVTGWQEFFDWHHLAGSLQGDACRALFAAGRGPAPTTVHGPRPEPLVVEALEVRDEVEPYEVGLFASKGGAAGAPWSVELRHDPRRLPAAAAGRLAGRLSALIGAALEAPSRRLDDLPLLSAADDAFLAPFEAPAAAGSGGGAGRAVHRRVADRAAEHPDAPAVRLGSTVWSYGELQRRVDGLAGHLASLGVGPEVTVALVLEPGPEAVAAVLAVLRAGGSYLPLDPKLPRRRMEWFLADSRVPVLVGSTADSERLRDLAGGGVRVVEVATDGPWPGASGAAPDAENDPDQAAYRLYTSGSTGEPKGVTVSHRSLAAYLEWAREELFAGGVPTLPMVSGLSFDAVLKQLFVPLLAGGTVEVLPAGAADLGALAAWLERRSEVALNVVPSVWSALLDLTRRGVEAGSDPLAGVRRLLLGGEATSVELLARTRRRLPAVEVWNLYGPTEVTANATAGVMSSAAGADPVPHLGRPLPGARVHVVGPGLERRPPGVVGEVAVAGPGLARGYHGRPGATAERFVPDPFSRRPGGRLYRTGDRARLEAGADGGPTLRFLGRVDAQLQLRGQRVEPAEVEAVLAGHPAVSAAAVEMRGGGPSAQLVAWYVAADGPAPDPDELKSYLRDRLAEALVPARLLASERLPRTAGGKLDRAALAARPLPSRSEECTRRRTGDAAEEILCGILGEVLGLPAVGPGDDFFALGGHSLLATQVISRIREAFGAELPLATFFAAPTAAGLASHLEAATRAGGARPPLRPAPGQGRRGPQPLSFGQRGLWFWERLQPGTPVYNVPLATRLEGDLDVGAMTASLAALVRRHESLRTRFEEDADGAPRQVILPPPPPRLPVTDLTALPAERRRRELERRLAAFATRPFDLTSGPLFRMQLLALAEGEHVLSITVHHIVCDGWSVGVLLRELSSLYTAAARRRPASLPPVPLQYADYAAWQRSWLDEELLAEEMDWWRQRLAGIPEESGVPTDHPRSQRSDPGGELEPFALGPDLASRLEALARRENATLFMVLLAAFAFLLARERGTGGPAGEAVVGTDVAHRTDRLTEGAVGFFVNQLVLRLELAGVTSYRDLLATARKVTLDAYAHQDVPFERLVRALEGRRRPGLEPLFQAKLVLQNAPRPDFDLAGLESAALEVGAGVAHNDLLLILTPDGGGWRGGWEYRSDLYDAATPRRLSAVLAALLEALADDPDVGLDELGEVAAEAEAGLRRLRRRDQRRLLDEFRGGGATPSSELLETLP